MKGWLAVILIVAVGYFSVRPLKLKAGALEKVALGWLVGSGILTFVLFWVGISGVFALFYVVFCLVLLKFIIKSSPLQTASFTAASSKNGANDLPLGRFSKFIPILWILLSIHLFYAIFSVFLLTTQYWDSVHFWHLKARFFMEEGSLGLAGDPSWILGGVKPHYPLHLPILKAFICRVAGGWSNAWALGTDVIGFVSFLIIAYRWLSSFHGRRAATVAVYIAASLPFIGIHLSAGYADLTLALYLAASVIYWDRWRRGEGKGYFVLSSFLIACAAWTKNDAFILYLPIMLIATFIVARWKSAAAYFGISILFLFPWIVFKITMGLDYSPNPGNQLLAFHPEAVSLFSDAFFTYGGFGIFWILFLPLLFYRPKAGSSFSIWTLSLSFLAVILALFTFTQAYEYLENNMTFQRSLLQVFPLFVVASMARVCDLLAERK
ncbi:MAG: hypothetical protein V3S46_07110 [Nitrospinota bacterium]